MTWLNNWLIEHFSFYQLAIKHADPRTKDWFLLWADPFPALILTIIYLFIVMIGPRYMRDRQAFSIPISILFSYNMILVILSAYLVEEIVVGVYRSEYNLICQKMTISYERNEMKISKALWFYYFSKVIEFFDTIFMIIRKRLTQITFLHVFHHSSMFILWWIVMTWLPSGQVWFGPLMNSIVHILMYAYYALSLIPALRKKLWWKRYITLFQLTQFIIVFCHTLFGIISGCDFPLWGQLILAGYMIIMLILFRNFYIHEYRKKEDQMSTILVNIFCGMNQW